MKTFKFRLYPTKKQKELLDETLNQCRYVYNTMLQFHITDYHKTKKYTSKVEMEKKLIPLKEVNPQLKNVYSHVLQDVVKRVDLAFQSFFRRIKNGEKPGFPKFKPTWCYNSFHFKEKGFILKPGKNKWSILNLSKIGEIEINIHRPIEGKIKTCTIKKDKNGKWWCNFWVIDIPLKIKKSHKEVGIDLGVSNLAVPSKGNPIKNPFKSDYSFKVLTKEIIEAQTKYSKYSLKHKKAKSKSKRKDLFFKLKMKYLQKLRKLWTKLDNKRNDYFQKESTKIVKEFGLICLEDFKPKNIKEDKKTIKGLRRSLHQAGCSTFKNLIEQKANIYKRTLHLVHPKYTTQACSDCGELVKKELFERTHNCPHCGLVLDRDLNAARNILKWGVSKHPFVKKSKAS